MACTTKNSGNVKCKNRLAHTASMKNVPKSSNKHAIADNINQKLKAAEERRIYLEQKKMADLGDQLSKVEAASLKRNEIDKEFSTKTKVNLETKMERQTEKRNAIIGGVRGRQQVRLGGIEKARQQMEEQRSVEKAAIESKLKKAEKLREQSREKALERVKLHNARIAKMREMAEDESRKIEVRVRIHERLHSAERNRLKELQKKIVNIKKCKDVASKQN